MAGDVDVHIGENSAEYIAYKLMKHIADSEDIRLESNMGGKANATREWILSTYAEAITAVKLPQKIIKTS